MTAFSFVASPAKGAALILPLFKEEAGKPKALAPLAGSERAAAAEALRHLPAEAEIAAVPGEGRLVVLALCGKKEGGRTLLKLGQEAVEEVRRRKAAECCVLPGSLGAAGTGLFREGAALGTYDADAWRGALTKREGRLLPPLKRLAFAGKAGAGELRRLQAVAEAVAFTKDIVNCPPSIANPSYVEAAARALAKKHGMKVTCLMPEKLASLGLHGILAVGRGAVEKPRLLILEYRKGPKGGKPVLLVGKGVCFDTGGLNLKSSEHILGMKMDNGGAATALGALSAVAALGEKCNVVCALPLVENAIGPDSYKPDDILTMHGGITVEVTNTDAEGRLILADALSYCSAAYKPAAVIDIATLTGASFVALGDDLTAVLGNDRALVAAVEKAAEKTGEPVWELPLHRPYRARLRSPVADILNYAQKLGAGVIQGGLFLEHFVPEGTPWCHMDIASVTFDWDKTVATGRNVRLLHALLASRIRG